MGCNCLHKVSASLRSEIGTQPLPLRAPQEPLLCRRSTARGAQHRPVEVDRAPGHPRGSSHRHRSATARCRTVRPEGGRWCPRQEALFASSARARSESALAPGAQVTLVLIALATWMTLGLAVGLAVGPALNRAGLGRPADHRRPEEWSGDRWIEVEVLRRPTRGRGPRTRPGPARRGRDRSGRRGSMSAGGARQSRILSAAGESRRAKRFVTFCPRVITENHDHDV